MFTERQQQIIESAVILIAEKGIQNLTMKNLSKAIGITEPGIYRHFRNKFEVIKNILVYFRIQMKPAIDELEKEENCIDCIVNFITAQLKIFSSNHHLAKVIFAEANFQNEEEFKNQKQFEMIDEQDVREMMNFVNEKKERQFKSVIL